MELQPRRFNLQGSGHDSRVGRSPALSSLPPLQLQPPGWQADGLLSELLHDLSDPGQVGFAEREVALRGPHVIANHAVLSGRGETFCLGCDHILSRVEEAPVIPVAGCSDVMVNAFHGDNSIWNSFPCESLTRPLMPRWTCSMNTIKDSRLFSHSSGSSLSCGYLSQPT